MQNNTVETLIAALVVAVAAGFLFFAYNSTHTGSISTYPLTANLGGVEGLKATSDVRVNGITIGSVTAIDLDTKTYRPIVHFEIRDDIHLPVDSAAWVTSGVMGTPYLTIKPGRSTVMLAAGQVLKVR